MRKSRGFLANAARLSDRLLELLPRNPSRLQEVAYQKAHLDSFRTVFPPGSAIFIIKPTPGLTEKGDSAFMQSHSCQLKSGLSAHMTGSSFLFKIARLPCSPPLKG